MSFNTGSGSQYRDISTIPVFPNLMISLQKFSLPTKVDSGIFPFGGDLQPVYTYL